MKIKEIIFLVEEDPEGGYTAKALGESIFTEADSLEEIKENIKNAISCHFDNEEDLPKYNKTSYCKRGNYSICLRYQETFQEQN